MFICPLLYEYEGSSVHAYKYSTEEANNITKLPWLRISFHTSRAGCMVEAQHVVVNINVREVSPNREDVASSPML